MWRALLALTRDVDLAEDCLQDTYIRARSGFSSYAGGSARAWLVTIARNVFFGLARRSYFSSEVSLDAVEEMAASSPLVDSDEHLSLLTIRDAISALAPELREALLLKHYGGCNYKEIGQHLSCSPEMAKHRVWRAMQKLRVALRDAEGDDSVCEEIRGPKILGWLYGSVSARRARKMEEHIALCPQCRQHVRLLRSLCALLDKCENDYRMLTLVDLDDQGQTTRYVWFRHINQRPDPMRVWRYNTRSGWKIEYLALQGEPVEVRWPRVPAEPGFVKIESDLPAPVPPGESIDAMFVACPPPEWNAERCRGIWHYHHAHSPFPSREGLLIVTIRLPERAKLIAADPKPDQTGERSERVSLTWRVITDVISSEEQEEKWQFEAELAYVLTTANRQ